MRTATYKDRAGKEFSFQTAETLADLNEFPSEYVLSMFHFGHSHRVGSVARAAAEAGTDPQEAIDNMQYTVGRQGSGASKPRTIAKVDVGALLAELARRGIDVSSLTVPASE